MNPLLVVDGLTVGFDTEAGHLPIVRGLSYEVRAGEVLAIVGESGSGKSVSSLAVMGLLADNAKVDARRLEFEGRNLLDLPKEELRSLRGRGISMIFQDPMSALNPVMTVGAQIVEPLRIHLGMDEAQARVRALELLSMVGIPDAERRIDQYPHQFSGGMRQRVMIAIGLSCGPRLLIADEPTTALDVTIQAQILDLMRDVCRRLQVALVLITHNLGVVARYADRVLVMYAGRMVEAGACAAVFAQPRHLYTAGLLASIPALGGERPERLHGIDGTPPNPAQVSAGCAFAPRCPAALGRCSQEHALVRTDQGSLSACVRAAELADGSLRWDSKAGQAAVGDASGPEDATSVQPLISLRGLRKTFHLRKGLFGKRLEVQALRDVTLDIARRETVGVVGESGCGKSTLGRLVLRLDDATEGSIAFDGQDITQLNGSALRGFRRRVQVVFQDPYSSLNPRHRVAEILAEPMRVHGLAGDAETAHRQALQLLQEVGLRPEHASRYPHQLSGGQRQRVAIARALAMQPDFIVCDEAVSALDVSVQAQVVNLLAELQERRGLSLMFIGHDLAVVRQIAHRVVVMYLGRVVEIAERDAFYAQPLHPYSQMLMAAVPVVGESPVAAPVVAIGEPPSPLAPPSGCAFRTRCPRATERCGREVPELRSVREGSQVACWNLG